ncbi:FtsK/SpoIIIE domain-containing protein [Actinomadura livida]|uniref:FtsK/SpoIIIE domain-containing protein n=1 Tax=Actinomadura livida TaxID=79909 RepID=A0A7W7IJ80_9ACTN|nr:MULTISPECIES: FtsK/SpoIIIE domain-containing protein [Actinomadura]MBB4778034.1 S-DNA-T family DNA segregation ATPase FtsK/SpoIIIE [Actinomadura catellatispora]GGT97058.1 cell division protein FtsK [Actinomadura livida]
MRISFTALTGGGPRDVVMDADAEATVDGVARSLAALLDGRAPAAAPARSPAAPRYSKDALRSAGVPGPRSPRALWLDGRMLDPQALAVKELRDGAVVAVERHGAAATVLGEPTGLVEVRVVGGPAAGSVHRLGLGVSTLGSGRNVDVVLDDPSVPARSLRLTVGREIVEAEASALTAEGGATLDGAPLAGKTTWPPGALLSVGSSVLALALSTAPDAHLVPLPDGGLAFDRPPRTAPQERARRLAVPERPDRSPRELLRPSFRRSLKEYQRRSGEFDGEVERLRRRDEAERRALHPDPAEVLLTATGPRRRLWERRRDDPDALDLRAGLADQPARIELTGGDAGLAVPVARQVPVAFPLADLGVVGLAGPRPAARALARWMVAQSAVLHSPRDLAVVVLSAGPDAGDEWNWVRWLPHCAPREGEDCVALVGTDAESAARRVTELAMQVTERRRTGAVPYNVLIVLDGAQALRRVPGMPMLLSRGPEFGLYAVCVDDEERLLPEECRAMAAWDPRQAPMIWLRQGLDVLGPVLADQVSASWAERVARALAPIRDLAREDAGDPVPSEVRLLDLLGMPDPTAEHVLRSWSRTGGRTARVPIGIGPDGPMAPHEIDLRADGPHALVAGASGAGTSELLRTLVASLAVANRPDEMTFVLIDHRGRDSKGRGVFEECARLPHTVSMVTDLDEHAAERALESLNAELRHREEILLEAGVEDVTGYEELRAAGRDLPPLPRLVIAVAEVAALAAELPEFVADLAGTARRGRPLGVHLVLATRRPEAVTDDIRAGVDLRIALRATDPEASTGMLGSPEAAQISRATPGRCYIRSGTRGPHRVQSARIGGPRPAAGAAGHRPAVRPLPWQDLGHPMPDPREAGPGAEAATDLGVLVQAVDEAARRAGIARGPSPWLNPLPEKITLTPRTAAGGSVVDVPPVQFGVTDLPAVQSREPLALDLAGGGHLYLAGSARSGRSTALRTIAGSIAGACSPYDVHLYAVDCGANALLPLGSLPHCGAVVARDRPGRCERLLAALTAEVARRHRLLAEAGFASLAEQRAAVAATDRLPWMVLLLDRWDGFLGAFEHHDHGRLVEQVVRLLREGAAVGLRAVFTGDRSGLGGQISTVFDRRLLLRMADPNDYAYGGLRDRQVPAAMPPGRALEPAAAGSPPRVSQIGVLGDDASGAAQAAVLQEIARACVSRYGRLPRRQRPLRVDELPVRVTYREAMSLDPDFLAPSALWALVGVGGDTLAPTGVDLLAEGPGLTVAGPPRSGRSTTLRTIAHSLLDPAVGGGLVPVVLVTPRRSPLRLLSGHPGVLGVLTRDSGAADLAEAIGDEHRYAVIVDDAELLREGQGGEELGGALRDVLRTARDGEHAVVIAGTTAELARGHGDSRHRDSRHGDSRHRDFVSDVARSRSGVLLSVESPEDGAVLGLALPRNTPPGGPTGRGVLVAAGRTAQIQVALPPPAADA